MHYESKVKVLAKESNGMWNVGGECSPDVYIIHQHSSPWVTGFELAGTWQRLDERVIASATTASSYGFSVNAVMGIEKP